MTQVIDAPQALARTNGNGHQSALAAMAGRYGITESGLAEVIKKTCIQGNASDAEFKAFVIVANQYGLNPLTREIHAFADPRKGIVPIVGIDGWSRIVNSQPRFDGCEFEDIRLEDGDVGITCTMYVKDRAKPIRLTEWLKECRRETAPWKTMPRRMLRHKAFMQTARLAFSIGGIFDEDEANDIVSRLSPDSQRQQDGDSPTDRVNARLASKVTTAAPAGETQRQRESVPSDEPEFVNEEPSQTAGAVQPASEIQPPAGVDDAFSAECFALASKSGHSDPELYDKQFDAAVAQATDGGKKRINVSAKSRIKHEIETKTGAFLPA